ncbi:MULTISPECIES: hypothetical protein [unclassified Variovorax]|jgi:hypothetical protein|nr:MULTISPECIES: hypothetical protein [unclassified Variovorax]KAF1070639.1 MAG: hypothetical protein GAK39_01836 [Variovorax sp.]SFO36702.1 hypothetical protein SAMN05443579_102647 [Variovorax sp. PDC80]
MQKTRVLGLCLAAGGLALLTGCVAVPGDPYYNGGYSGGYSDPYYSDPVVVQPAPVYINGGGTYYDRRPYYRDRPYYGRPAYPYPSRPGWNGNGGGRPGWGGRPPAVVPPVALPRPQPQRTVPVTPGTGRGVPGALPGMPGYVPQNIAPSLPGH